MIRVLFICLGNICRSPMAEFMFKDLVKRNGLEEEILIDSAATSYEEIGNDIHYGAMKKLTEQGIPYSKHKARRIEAEDYKKYDYILAMEERNINSIKRIVGEDDDNKVFRLLDFSEKPRDIADPWYTGDFDTTYKDIQEGLKCFLEYIRKG